MVNATPRPLYPQGRDLLPIVREAGWAPVPVWTGAENLTPTGFDPRTVQAVTSRYTDFAVAVKLELRLSSQNVLCPCVYVCVCVCARARSCVCACVCSLLFAARKSTLILLDQHFTFCFFILFISLLTLNNDSSLKKYSTLFFAIFNVNH